MHLRIIGRLGEGLLVKLEGLGVVTRLEGCAGLVVPRGRLAGNGLLGRSSGRADRLGVVGTRRRRRLLHGRGLPNAARAEAGAIVRVAITRIAPSVHRRANAPGPDPGRVTHSQSRRPPSCIIVAVPGAVMVVGIACAGGRPRGARVGVP